MTENERSECKPRAQVSVDRPVHFDGEPTPDGVTSVAIAAEAIGEGCGLGNYLAGLRSALDAQCGARRQLRMMEPTALPRRRPIDRFRVSIRRLLHPLFHPGVPFKSPPRKPAWDRAWRALDAQTVCLLPQVVCLDGGALDDYYSVLSARRLVLVVHDLNPLHFPDLWDPQSVDILLRRSQSLVACARKIIVHNNYTKTDVCRRLGADPAKIAIARLPGLLPQCQPEALPPVEKTLQELGIRRPYALWASSSTFGHKNHDRLVKAWRILRAQGKNLQLVCTGSKAPRWAALEQLIRELGLEGSVVFTDTLPREAMWVVMANATMAVCPTLFEGGCSGPVAEAATMGIPVACARIPQIQEQFDFREDLCEWFDPLDELAIASAVTKILHHRQAAMNRAQHTAAVYPTLTSWEAVANTYWKELDAAARDKPS